MAELRTNARPYAKAAFAHALAANTAAKWAESLQLLAALLGDQKVARLLGSPELTADKKAQHLGELLGDELTPDLANFIAVLAENNRLALLPLSLIHI